jgi:hypothetical protein
MFVHVHAFYKVILIFRLKAVHLNRAFKHNIHRQSTQSVTGIHKLNTFMRVSEYIACVIASMLVCCMIAANYLC